MENYLDLTNVGKCFHDCRNNCPYIQDINSASIFKDKSLNEEQDAYIIHVHLQPEEKDVDIPRKKAKNVSMLLNTLHILPYTSIVFCGEMLLTPDSPLYSGQHIKIRKVMSSG